MDSTGIVSCSSLLLVEHCHDGVHVTAPRFASQLKENWRQDEVEHRCHDSGWIQFAVLCHDWETLSGPIRQPMSKRSLADCLYPCTDIHMQDKLSLIAHSDRYLPCQILAAERRAGTETPSATRALSN